MTPQALRTLIESDPQALALAQSGAAFHSSDTNQVITFTPLEESIEDAL